LSEDRLADLSGRGSDTVTRNGVCGAEAEHRYWMIATMGSTPTGPRTGRLPFMRSGFKREEFMGTGSGPPGSYTVTRSTIIRPAVMY
jgi:hypothetical protein